MIFPKICTILPLLVSLALAGDLNVKRDMSVAATKGYKDGQFVWTSIVDLEKKEKVLPEEMVKIAHEASKEMQADFGSVPEAKQPSIMTAMEIDNRIYLASSMKGDYSFIYDFKTKDKGGKVGNGSIRKGVPKEIADALGDAQSTGSGEDRNNVQHKNDASCGELMASYTYLLKNSGQSLKNKKPKQTIAWLYTKTKDGKSVQQAHNPCGTKENAWGCDLFCHHMGFTPINVDTEEACDLPKIANTEQQQLMTKELRAQLDAMNKETDDANKEKQKEKNKKKQGDEGKNKGQKKEEDDKKGKGGKKARFWSV